MGVESFSTKRDSDKTPIASAALSELDRVKLTRPVSDKGRMLPPGLEGTVVLCHGTEAYEVEFDSISDDFFQISAKDLEKTG